MESIKLGLQHGFFAIGDRKDISDFACADQQNLVHSPILAASSRRGFLKSNTTALAGGVTALFNVKTARINQAIAVDDAGNLNTI